MNHYIKKAELHCHSSFSQKSSKLVPFLADSVQTVEQILFECLKKGISIVCISDHNHVEGGLYAQQLVKDHKLPILVIPGAEVSTKTGHILALGITKNIPRHLSPQKALNLIHEQNGFAIAAHPYLPVKGFGRKLYSLDFDAIEGFNAAMPKWINLKAQKTAKLIGLPGIAASDAHETTAVGNGLTLFPKEVDTMDKVITALKARLFETSCKRTSYTSSIRAHLRHASHDRLLTHSASA